MLNFQKNLEVRMWTQASATLQRAACLSPLETLDGEEVGRTPAVASGHYPLLATFVPRTLSAVLETSALNFRLSPM